VADAGELDVDEDVGRAQFPALNDDRLQGGLGGGCGIRANVHGIPQVGGDPIQSLAEWVRLRPEQVLQDPPHDMAANVLPRP
jgi:hypothetical protein